MHKSITALSSNTKILVIKLFSLQLLVCKSNLNKLFKQFSNIEPHASRTSNTGDSMRKCHKNIKKRNNLNEKRGDK